MAGNRNDPASTAGVGWGGLVYTIRDFTEFANSISFV